MIEPSLGRLAEQRHLFPVEAVESYRVEQRELLPFRILVAKQVVLERRRDPDPEVLVSEAGVLDAGLRPRRPVVTQAPDSQRLELVFPFDALDRGRVVDLEVLPVVLPIHRQLYLELLCDPVGGEAPFQRELVLSVLTLDGGLHARPKDPEVPRVVLRAGRHLLPNPFIDDQPRPRGIVRPGDVTRQSQANRSGEAPQHLLLR